MGAILNRDQARAFNCQYLGTSVGVRDSVFKEHLGGSPQYLLFGFNRICLPTFLG